MRCVVLYVRGHGPSKQGTWATHIGASESSRRSPVAWLDGDVHLHSTGTLVGHERHVKEQPMAAERWSLFPLPPYTYLACPGTNYLVADLPGRAVVSVISDILFYFLYWDYRASQVTTLATSHQNVVLHFFV